MKPKVCIIILMYNTVSKLGKNFLINALNSISSQDYENFELIIIDNGSIDNTSSYVRKYFLNQGNSNKVKWHILTLLKNYGWSGGNNRGAIMCRGMDYLFFVNDDVIFLDNNVISKLVDFLIRNPEIGAVQPLIINRDKSINCGFDIGFTTLVEPNTDPNSEPFFVSGAALFTRNDVFFKVGGFDEDLFLMHDDLDYCYRVRLAGYGVKCLKEVRVYHYGGATFGQSPLTWYFYLRNAFYVLAKNSEIMYLLLRISLLIVEELMGNFWYAFRRLKRYDLALVTIMAITHGLLKLGKFLTKRHEIYKNVSERHLIRKIDPRIDLMRILPQVYRYARRT